MGQAKRKRYATAMHEASHVVVGLDCGRGLVRCSIVPEDAFGGYGLGIGSTEWERIGNGTVGVRAVVKIALAGKAAEERMYGNARYDLALIYALAWLATVGSEKFTPQARLIWLLTGFYCEHPHKVPPRAKRLADEMISVLLPEVQDILERRWHDVDNCWTAAETRTNHARDDWGESFQTRWRSPRTSRLRKNSPLSLSKPFRRSVLKNHKLDG
jgi:hypothetical protein